MRLRFPLVSSLVALSSVAGASFAATPFATHWITYNPGSNAALNYTDPASALGRPSRFTGDNAEFLYPSAVTAFNGAFNYDQVLSIGTGGHIILGFDAPVRDDPEHHFGLELLVFGNASFVDADYPNGIVDGIFSEGGTVELSADGITWITATGVTPDGAVPTVGYSDLLDPFAITRGSDPSDFRLPVDPSFDFMGMNNAEVLAAYNGSGGGTGIDIGAYGLSVVNFIRISNSGPSAIEIDAVSRVSSVPSPAAAALIGLTGLGLTRRRRA